MSKKLLIPEKIETNLIERIDKARDTENTKLKKKKIKRTFENKSL